MADLSKATPLRLASLAGGWDGIYDRNGQLLYRLALDDQDLALAVIRAVNERDELIEALRAYQSAWKRPAIAVPLFEYAEKLADAVLAKAEDDHD